MQLAERLYLLLAATALVALASSEAYRVNWLKPDGKYLPTWESLDTRPAPRWFDQSKIGIFLHWGVFSVPSFGGEWFWHQWHAGNKDAVNFMKNNFRPGFSYADFASDFTAEFYNATQWAELFDKAGAQYVVLTSKHHEGFTLWPSKTSFNWNSVDVGPKRDLLGELADASRAQGLHFGVYHSLYEWFNPMYISDKKNDFTTQQFVSNKALPELYELVNKYQPEVIWSDGDWEASDVYWNATNFLAWLYNDSPVKDRVLVNDRWGIGVPCKHGDFYNCKDRYNPGVLLPHKWENAMTLDRSSWGYRRRMTLEDVMTFDELITTLVQTVSCNGNLLVNIGPRKDGTIDPIFEERLLQMGDWLKINGEAIYASRPWIHQNDTLNSNVWYTSGTNSLYVIILKPSDIVRVGALDSTRISNAHMTLLGTGQSVNYHKADSFVEIALPALRPKGAVTVKVTNYRQIG